jgi:cellulose synthase/poly-beta-1,6-N-acetylglucosamine synthase-like glycosyltransferase
MAEHELPTIAVIVPAHNMEMVIVRCVESLKACRYPVKKFEIVVVADHCTDETAVRARQAGVSVLEREVGPAGKTYALAWALEELDSRRLHPDQYVITDATAWVEQDFLRALAARWMHGEDIVVGRSVVATENQQWFARCLALTLVHRNLQNGCRERLGLSSLIEGRGMAYSRRYIERFGWSLALPTSASASSHPTEDWRHGVRAVEHGYRVAFAGDARVVTPLRETLSAATQQGVRWERGRMSNAMTHGLRVLWLGIRERNLRKLLAALDAIQPPVAILGALCVVIAAFAAFLPRGPRIDILGFVPLALVGLYGVVVAAYGRKEGIKLTTIAWAPVYLAWRSLAFVLAWVKK